MNNEVDQVLMLLGQRRTQDLFILSANFSQQTRVEGAEEEDEWRGFIQKTKQYMEDETKKISHKIKAENKTQNDHLESKFGEVEQNVAQRGQNAIDQFDDIDEMLEQLE